MNGLHQLVYHVTQHSALMQEILADPSLLSTYANLSAEQINAFMEIVGDQQLVAHLQSLTTASAQNIYWSYPWGGG